MSERAIDRVRKAVAARRRRVVVPEWDNLELYFSALTTSDMIAVEQHMAPRPKDGNSGETDGAWKEERTIVLLILKAENEDGSPAFEFGDKELLSSKADYVVVKRLYAELLMAGQPTVSAEEAKTDSETTTSSVSE